MPISNEEKQYLQDGVNILFTKTTSKTTALRYIQDDLSLEEILSKLNRFLKKDFVATASANGIITPNSVVYISSSDVPKMQSFVGYQSAATLPEDQQNLVDSLSALSNSLNNLNRTTQAENQILNYEIEALKKSVTHIHRALGIKHNTKNNSHDIKNTTIVTSCKYSQGTYTLRNIIAKAENSRLDMLKASIKCSKWAAKKEDHYLSTTGDISDCGPYIPPEMAYSECLSAIGISAYDTDDPMD